MMVTLPPGRFWMGSPDSEEGRRESEGPRHAVSIAYPLALGRDPVSVDAFAAFIARTGHDMGSSARVWTGEKWEDTPGKGWRDPGFAQTGEHPVTCVSWEDATAYVAWLNETLGLAGRRDAYRLPSEAEWEYACRAGTTTPFSFGETISTTQANYDGNYAYGRGRKTGRWRKATTPAGTFPVNAFGLRDMHGNVLEWCADGWNQTYGGGLVGREDGSGGFLLEDGSGSIALEGDHPPTDGSAWLSGAPSLRVVRGGSWYDDPQFLRSAYRDWGEPTDRNDDIGFRLARTLSPPTP
jgi:formylglycine-generating enzyme required for sulfatase activity